MLIQNSDDNLINPFILKLSKKYIINFKIDNDWFKLNCLMIKI